jgi:hypothetical protein
MNQRRRFFYLVTSVVLSVQLGAQVSETRPNLSGNWLLLPEASTSGQASMTPYPLRLSLEQDEKKLAIAGSIVHRKPDRTFEAVVQNRTIYFDGYRKSLDGVGRWDGSKLEVRLNSYREQYEINEGGLLVVNYRNGDDQPFWRAVYVKDSVRERPSSAHK